MKLILVFFSILAWGARADSVWMSDQQLIYTPEQMRSFDLSAYLSRYKPHLLPYREVIAHWSGYTSVSPKVILTLLDHLSTHNKQDPQPGSLQALSTHEVSAQQIQEIALFLSQRIYQRREQGEYRARELLEGLLPDSHASFSARYYQMFPEEKGQKYQPQGVAVAPDVSMLQLPFPAGESWWMGGSHTNTGSGSYPQSSLDMNNGGRWGSDTSDKWVVAAAAGEVVVHSSCFVEVLHSQGWSTTYYHLDNIRVTQGQRVARDTRLANYANSKSQALCDGGHSSGPHQHFSLKLQGGYYHLNEVSLSGYQVHTGRDSYDSNCNYFWLTREGQRYCVNNKIVNHALQDYAWLEDKIPVSGLQDNEGAMKRYRLHLPFGGHNLSFRLTGEVGKGDPDMYLRYANWPDLNRYDCRPYATEPFEECVFATPEVGDFYALLHAYSDYSDFSLVGDYQIDQDLNRQLELDSELTGLSASKGNSDRYYFDLPPEVERVKVELSGGSGDADLHLKYRLQTDLDTWDCRPYKTSQLETCELSTPDPGRYFILLHAFSEYREVNLTVSVAY